jgi:hypothetical protein
MVYKALDTETYKGKAFLLSHPLGIVLLANWENFADFCYDNGKRFTFFNMEYDVSALLKFLPEKVVEQIYLEKYARWQGYKFRYLAGKYFQVSSARGTLHFYDLYPFFQTSLDTASKKYLGKRKKELPKGIIARNGISPTVYKRNRKLVNSYAIQDAKLLQGLTDLITESLKEIDLEIQHLYSPGYVAKKFLRKNGVKVSDVPPEFRGIIEKSYHGARIEVVKRGTFKRTKIYDIKSAYPEAFAKLPDFLKATYYSSKKIESKYFVAKVRIWMKAANIYLLPWKTPDKLTIFPRFQGQETVITSLEYDYLRKHKLCDKIEVLEVINIVTKRGKPFARMIKRLFLERKKSQAKSILFKLILNSMYGIFAERIEEYEQVSFVRGYYQGLRQLENNYRQLFITRMALRCSHARVYWKKECKCSDCKFVRQVLRRRKIKDKSLFMKRDKFYVKRKKGGRFRNLTIAAFVTASARVKIFDYARKADNGFLACFTDSIIATGNVNFKTGENLGDLEKKYSGKTMLLGSGIYETKDETKTRGFRWKQKLTALLRKNKNKHVIAIPQKMRVSLGIFVRRPVVAFDDFNAIKDKAKNLELNFDRKRVWKRNFKNAGDVLQSQISSAPISLDKLT